MKQGRFPIRTLMTRVAFVAVNLAVLRALYSTRRIDLLVGGFAFWTALQVCGSMALRRRGRARAYWVGVVAGGVIGALTLIVAASLPGSFLGAAWKSYVVAADGLLFNDRTVDLIIEIIGTGWLDLADALALTGIVFFPLVLAAWVGGLSARLIHKRIV